MVILLLVSFNVVVFSILQRVTYQEIEIYAFIALRDHICACVSLFLFGWSLLCSRISLPGWSIAVLMYFKRNFNMKRFNLLGEENLRFLLIKIE